MSAFDSLLGLAGQLRTGAVVCAGEQPPGLSQPAMLVACIPRIPPEAC